MMRSKMAASACSARVTRQMMFGLHHAELWNLMELSPSRSSRLTGPSSAEAKLRGLERAKGIEPSSVAWEATALPLSYARARDALSMRSRALGTLLERKAPREFSSR